MHTASSECSCFCRGISAATMSYMENASDEIYTVLGETT
jgi:hypothetical protein